MTSTTTSTESRALQLLGQGLGPEIVAAAVGVTTSRISQLISDPNFASQVADLRFKNLSAHNERDNRYDSLEDKLLQKLENLLPFMMKPLEVLRAIQVINGAKRRGANSPETLATSKEVVTLLMPTQVVNHFSQNNLTLNANQMVVKVGEQDLTTIQSGNIDRLVALQPDRKVEQNVQIPSFANSQ